MGTTIRQRTKHIFSSGTYYKRGNIILFIFYLTKLNRETDCRTLLQQHSSGGTHIYAPLGQNKNGNGYRNSRILKKTCIITHYIYTRDNGLGYT